MLNKKRNIQALRFVELRSRITFLILCSLAFITYADEVTQARSLSKRSVVQEVSKEEILAAERRLSDLGYWTGPVDGTLDSASRHALIAFQKVEGRKRTGKLTSAELQALLSAVRPLPKYSGYAHVEIDLTRQVLIIVDATGTITHILPVCTGNEKPYVDHGQIHRAHTPRGRFRVLRKIAGWRLSSLGLLYYPNYIHNGIAIHGSLAMAVYPASHGCIRIPMFASKKLSELTPVGTEVIVYDDLTAGNGETLMRKNIEPLSWQSDLAAFGKRNNMRPTRLEVLGPAREFESDFWLEDGLLLAGIDLDTDGERGLDVEIMLQAPSASSKNHMTHTVAGVKRLELETTDGRDAALEIEDEEGKVTIMHFESERPAF